MLDNRPDAIYWRRTMWHPEIEYADLENVWFWPGEGLCVDGYYYWQVGRRWRDRSRRFAKRIPREIWIQWGRKRHSPPTEKHAQDAYQEVLAYKPEGRSDWRECPNCHYVDPPYWRTPPFFSEVDYMRFDEFQELLPLIAEQTGSSYSSASF